MKIDLPLNGIEIHNATQRTVAILGQKGTGKTMTLKMLAYRLLDYNVGIYVLDLLNVIRIRGFKKIVIKKGEADKGDKLASLLNNNKRMRVIIGFEGLLQGETAEFMDKFFSVWKPKNAIVLIDEIHEFLPESTMGSNYSFEAERAIRHWRNAKEEVGNVGFFFSSQRPQFVNKKILALSDAWFLFRVVGDRDRKPIMDTLSGVLTDEQLNQIITELPQKGFLQGYYVDFYK